MTIQSLTLHGNKVYRVGSVSPGPTQSLVDRIESDDDGYNVYTDNGGVHFIHRSAVLRVTPQA